MSMSDVQDVESDDSWVWHTASDWTTDESVNVLIGRFPRKSFSESKWVLCVPDFRWRSDGRWLHRIFYGYSCKSLQQG
jgi:hypothetical protein